MLETAQFYVYVNRLRWPLWASSPQPLDLLRREWGDLVDRAYEDASLLVEVSRPTGSIHTTFDASGILTGFVFDSVEAYAYASLHPVDEFSSLLAGVPRLPQESKKKKTSTFHVYGPVPELQRDFSRLPRVKAPLQVLYDLRVCGYEPLDVYEGSLPSVGTSYLVRARDAYEVTVTVLLAQGEVERVSSRLRGFPQKPTPYPFFSLREPKNPQTIRGDERRRLLVNIFRASHSTWFTPEELYDLIGRRGLESSCDSDLEDLYREGLLLRHQKAEDLSYRWKGGDVPCDSVENP